jgi:hypothetical protein
MAGLDDQAKLIRAIQNATVEINKQLDQQLRIHLAIAKATKEGNASRAQGAQINEEVAAAYQAAGIKIGGASAKMSSDIASGNAAVAGSADATAASLSTSADASSGLLGAIGENVALAEKTLDNFNASLQSVIPKDLKEELQRTQGRFGGLGTDLRKLTQSADAAAAAQKGLNKESYALGTTSLGLYDSLQGVAEGFEFLGVRTERALGSLEQASGYYKEIFIENASINARYMDQLNEKQALNMAAFGKGLALSERGVRALVQRQLSRFGTDMNKMLAETAAFSKAIEKQTGISAKEIATGIAGIIEDTKNFGNVTVEEAARITTSLRQIGIDYGDLQGMLGKFQGFESAAGAVADLTTVLGVNLDAMEMMKLANSDQETFLRTMREQFIMTGKSVDEMSLPMKRMVQSTLGLADISSVERLFDPDATISSFEDLSMATAGASTDQQDALKGMKDDLLELADATDYDSKAIKGAIVANINRPFVNAALEAEQSTTKIVGSLEAVASTQAFKEIKAGGEAMGDLAKFAGIDPSKIKSVAEELQSMALSTGQLVEAMGDGTFVGKFKELMKSNDMGESLKEGFKVAFTDVVGLFNKMIDRLEKAWQDGPGSEGSMSEWGKSFHGGFDAAFKETGKDAQSAFSEMGVVANKEFATMAAKQGSVAHNLAKEMAKLKMTHEDLNKELTSDDKKMLIEKLHMSKTATEAQIKDRLKVLMKSKSFKEQEAKDKQTDWTKKILESYKEKYGKDAVSKMGAGFKKELAAKYGIEGDEALQSAMSGDIGKNLRSGSSRIQEIKDAEAEAERVKKEKSRSRDSDRRRSSSVNLGPVVAELKQVKDILSKLGGTGAEGDQTVRVVTTDGQPIIDFIMNNNLGLGGTTQFQTKKAGSQK